MFIQKMFFNVLSHYNHYMSCDLILSPELAFFLKNMERLPILNRLPLVGEFNFVRVEARKIFWVSF